MRIPTAVKDAPVNVDRFKSKRDRLVTHYGWLLIRGLGRVFARQSLVGDAPFLDNRNFSFVDDFTDNWEAIRDEVIEILHHREVIPVFHEISPEQRHISIGDSWRTFVLFGFGTKLEQNCRYAPVTAALLERVPNLENAWFSILAPGYHIPAHTGVSKGIVRAHLGLVIPRDAERCCMRVGDEVRVWRPGDLFVFDDTFDHEVWNDTLEERVVLVFDVDRPMRRFGRLLNRVFVRLLKLTAFYREPKRRMVMFEDRFEAAVRRADSDPQDGDRGV